MGLASYLRGAVADIGRVARSGKDAVVSAAQSAAGLTWANRYELLGFTAAAASFGTIGGASLLVKMASTATLGAASMSLAESLLRTTGGRKDPVFTKKNAAQKRKRDNADSRKEGVPSVDSEGKKPRVSGDMRSRLANLASV